ncbi:MAG: hypothetical protein AAGA83_10565 [Cyanobacteria bacterium P01_F01_bin.116]
MSNTFSRYIVLISLSNFRKGLSLVALTMVFGVLGAVSSIAEASTQVVVPRSNGVRVAGFLDVFKEIGETVEEVTGTVEDITDTVDAITAPFEERTRAQRAREEQQLRELEAARLQQEREAAAAAAAEQRRQYWESLTPEQKEAYLAEQRRRQQAQQDAVAGLLLLMLSSDSGGNSSSSDQQEPCHRFGPDGTYVGDMC